MLWVGPGKVLVIRQCVKNEKVVSDGMRNSRYKAKL